ncbi:MAG: response regulator [Clostridia bacterium]|nr:response regulator [Clostridia bacterium]
MSKFFGETLRKLRQERGINQYQLANALYVSRPTVTRWENGTRLPDAVMIKRIAEYFGVEVNALLGEIVRDDENPQVILVDDAPLILRGGLSVLSDALDRATVTGFSDPSEALEYARSHYVALAFLDIDMGSVSGIDLCRQLLEINDHTNVVFLTAYMEYSLDAWSTGASGFLLKPLTTEAVHDVLPRLRYPIFGGGRI